MVNGLELRMLGCSIAVACLNAMPREPLQQVLPKYYRCRITAGPYRSW
jgi:hypothetical protein